METSGVEKSMKTHKKHTCGGCSSSYDVYKDLLCHLFWRHGTESSSCSQCNGRRWHFALHMCDVLPYEEEMFDECAAPNCRESIFCYCGKDIPEAPMIACDGDACQYHWYHFTCVGVTEPPDGKWLCPSCTK